MAPAAKDGALAQPISFGGEASEVIARAITTKFRERFQKRCVKRIGSRNVRNMDGAIDAMHRRIAQVGIAFGASKHWQNASPVPAAIAFARPVVIVQRMTTVVGHAIDRAGTAYHFAAGQR
jgi:hypothetical protein